MKKPNHFYYIPDQDIAEAITQTLQDQTGDKIFTMRIIGENAADHSLQALIVFESKAIMDATITVMPAPEGLAGLRIKGRFIE